MQYTNHLETMNNLMAYSWLVRIAKKLRNKEKEGDQYAQALAEILIRINILKRDCPKINEIMIHGFQDSPHSFNPVKRFTV